MSVLALPATAQLTWYLQTLCATPSSTGQLDDLRATAALIGDLVAGLGFQVRCVATEGAPVLIAQRPGRSPRTLLLYHHYDVAPPGPWRAWSHEPFQLAERDGALYGRGVAAGKGPLAAHLQAIAARLQADGELPCGVTMVIEGAGLAGSAHLAAALDAHLDLLRADLCLGSAGERDAAGVPICYCGSKGMLQVRLTTGGAGSPLPAGMAPSLRNPLWRLIWALSAIKGDDEDIRIAGFYDSVEGPTREENAQLRRISLDEAARLTAWSVPGFLFGMSGAALVRAEATLPTCNVSRIECDPSGDLALIPAGASAVIDLQLVPQQDPTAILALLSAHLAEQGFADVAVTPLPGGYRPVRAPTDHPLLAALAEAGAAVYGAPLPTASAGPFSLPLQLFAARTGAPVASIGLARPANAALGPDEHLSLEDLTRHGLLLQEILTLMGI